MIRKATLDDVKPLAKLYKDYLVFHNNLDPVVYTVLSDEDCEKRVKWFLENTEIFNALCHENDDNAIDGYITYMLPDKNSASENSDGTITIISIVVAEGARGKGIGEELIDQVCKLAKGNYANCISASVSLYNGIARRFFERMGMIPTTIHLEKRL